MLQHSEQDEIYYPFRVLGLHQHLPDGHLQKTFINEGDPNLFIFKLVNFTLRPARVGPPSHSLNPCPKLVATVRGSENRSARTWKPCLKHQHGGMVFNTLQSKHTAVPGGDTNNGVNKIK